MDACSQTSYEWSTLRKLWHIAGCAAIIALFQLWKDIDNVVNGANIIVAMAWLVSAFLVAIDVVRLNFPEQQAIIERLPFYGKMIREDERQHFNASTYLILATAILATAWRLGLLSGTALMQAVAVVGLADPAAAWVRFLFWRRKWIGGRKVALLVFVLVAAAAMMGVSVWTHEAATLPVILLVTFVTAVVEGYIGRWVRLTQRVTQMAQDQLPPRISIWLRRVYPDDNLLIPLMVAMLSQILAGIV